jgi:hypothetical protein
MKHATGGGLPARIFKTFMEAAEVGVPVKPLVALANAPDQAAATDAAPSEPSGLSQFLDSLLGKSGT